MNNGLLDIHLNHDLAHIAWLLQKKKPTMDHEQTQQR